MNKSIRNGVLGLAVTIGALVAHSGDSFALGRCTSSYSSGTELGACLTSLSEEATGNASPSGGNTILNVTFVSGQSGAQAFLLTGSGAVFCSTILATAANPNRSATCGGSGFAFFRLEVN